MTEGHYSYPYLSDISPLWECVGLQFMVALAALAFSLTGLLATHSTGRLMVVVVLFSVLAYIFVPAIALGLVQSLQQRRGPKPARVLAPTPASSRHVLLTDLGVHWPLHLVSFAIGGAAIVHGSMLVAVACCVAGWILLIVRLAREWQGRGFIEVRHDSLLLHPAGAPGTEPMTFAFDDPTLGMSLLRRSVRLHTRAGDFDIPLNWTSRPKTLTDSLLGKVLIVTDRVQARADERAHERS